MLEHDLSEMAASSLSMTDWQNSCSQIGSFPPFWPCHVSVWSLLQTLKNIPHWEMQFVPNV